MVNLQSELAMRTYSIKRFNYSGCTLQAQRKRLIFLTMYIGSSGWCALNSEEVNIPMVFELVMNVHFTV